MRRESHSLTPLGREIKKKLVDLGLTHQDFANEIGIAPQYLAHILYGRRTGEKYISKIAVFLEIDMQRFIV